MQITTELRPLFQYSIIPVIILTISVLIIIIYMFKGKRKTSIQKVMISNPKDIFQIKAKYLNIIQKLLYDLENKNITSRKAYQELSRLIRNFIYEISGIKVQNYTLNEIEETNIPILYELVKEYYDPEFSKISQGNIIKSIRKTEEVIEKWN